MDLKTFMKLILTIKSKNFFFRNLRKKGNKIYFECVFGTENLLKKYFIIEKKFKSKNYKNNILGINSKFKDINNFKNFFEKNLKN